MYILFTFERIFCALLVSVCSEIVSQLFTHKLMVMLGIYCTPCGVLKMSKQFENFASTQDICLQCVPKVADVSINFAIRDTRIHTETLDDIECNALVVGTILSRGNGYIYLHC